MAVKWTDEQRKVIETLDKGVAVPAAAGSGKTTVLIERTVSVLEDKDADCPSEKLLAVTFTKDAANNMKKKLRAALASRIVAETDPEKRNWLERQQEMLPLAKISTINSFCLELVKNNLNEFDFRTGVKIADDAQADVMLGESLEVALEQMRKTHPDEFRLLIDSLSDNSEKELSKEICRFYEFKKSLAFPDEWIEQARLSFTDKERQAHYTEALMYEYEKVIAKAQKLNEKALYLAKKTVGCESVASLLLDDSDVIGSVKAPVLGGDYKQTYKAITELKFQTLRKPKGKGLTVEETITLDRNFEDIKSLREAVKKQLGKLKTDIEKLGGDIEAPMKKSGEIFDALCIAAQLLEKEFSEQKAQRGVAQFGDVERMTMDLLIKKENGKLVRTEFAKKLRESGAYKMILIDEYQDVNNLQEMIFRAISDTDDLEMLGKNVFIVGDVKQSIYRFRLSNPKLFIKAVKNAEAPENTQLEKIRLSANFRSRQNVIDMVNRTFSALMSEELGELEYSADEKLRRGAEFPEADPPVELLMIRESDRIDDDMKYVIFGTEELFIARRIKSILSSGRQVRDGKKTRPVRPEDICVLMRYTDSCSKMCAALQYVGLKVQNEQVDGYMASREIVVMINLLKVIDNPMKDLSLAAVMLSPILNFTAEETAKLRLLCNIENSADRKRLYQVLNSASKSEDADEKEAKRIDIGDPLLEEKCRYAVELIKRLRYYSVSMTLEALISKIYDETGFYAVASAFENSKQKRANLRLLAQRASEYEKDSSGGIAGFLRYLDSVSDRGGDFSQAITVTSGEGSVSVKTMHSSKGLEFPIVFLGGLNKPFSERDKKNKLLLNETLGAGINYLVHEKLMKVNTIAHKALEVVTRNEMLSEELRLLYVAMTRAEEQLIIPIFFAKNKRSDLDIIKRFAQLADEIMASGGITPDILLSSERYGEWLAAVIMLTEQNYPLLEEIDRGEYAADFADWGRAMADKPVIKWTDNSEYGTTEERTKIFSAPEPDNKSVKRLREKYEFVYPNEQARAASKRTVTEIVNELRERENKEADTLFYPQLGSLDDEAKRLTAAERGTFTHLFMELANYENAEKSVDDELERLVRDGVFTEREAMGVYKSAVKAYFDSDFYARVKASDEIRREMKFMVEAHDAGIDEAYPDMIASDGMVQGVCDCIFKEPDGYVLVDYKTDGFTDISELDKYGTQLDLYKRALDKILDKPVKACYIYSFRLSKGKEIVL
ncbi:MAG: helicase-exonuclease AddAB subunit AddA [Oscillospiraceae bacterium]